MRVHTPLAFLAAAAPLATAQTGPTTAPPLTNTTVLPRHFGIVIFPHLTPLDMFGPMEALIGLTLAYGNHTGKMHMSILGADDAPTWASPPNAYAQFGMPLHPTITFDAYRGLAASNFAGGAKGAEKGPIDVLLVPGGGGTRGNMTREIAFVKEMYPAVQYMMSVCTGSTILARAGVLDNKRATTNKRAWDWATTFGKNVTYTTGRWVQDGNTWSSSGVSAGTDAMVAFIAHLYGEAPAQWVADNAEITRWTDASRDPFAERWGVKQKTTE